MQQNLVIIACSIFRYELEQMVKGGKIKVPIVYLSSMLHMQPEKLQTLLDAKIEEYKNFRIILIYGDCHARMVDYEEQTNIVRTPGINCCEIILGKSKYRKIRNDGAFILLPEWSERWKEVFLASMGFKTSEAVKSFMAEMHKKIVYVDTGLVEKSNPLLNEISDFLGLPLEIYPSTTVELETVIQRLIEQSNSTEKQEDGR
jgi:hypothetical protein